MFGKNKNAKVDAEYKSIEKKIMEEAKERETKKKLENYDNETIEVSRLELYNFMEQLQRYNSIEDVEGFENIANFLGITVD